MLKTTTQHFTAAFANFVQVTEPSTVRQNSTTDAMQDIKTVNSECGIFNAIASLQSGKQSLEGMFPWTAAIFGPQSFIDIGVNFTTGAIISTKHIFTEAYFFVLLQSHQLKAVKIYVGLEQLSTISEETRFHTIEKTLSHPNFRFAFPFESNVGIIRIEDSLTFSQNVFPICIWDSTLNDINLSDQTGFAVGYGITGTKDKEFAALKISDEGICKTKLSFLLNDLYDSERHLCVTGNTKSAPCWGYSFALYLNHRNVWYLLASGSFLDVVGSTCNVDVPILFEHIKTSEKWMREVVTRG